MYLSACCTTDFNIYAVLRSLRNRRKEKKQPTVVTAATGPAAGYLTTTTGFGEKTPNVINSVAANTVTRANPSLAVFGNTHSSANSYAFYEDADDIPVLAGIKDGTRASVVVI